MAERAVVAYSHQADPRCLPVFPSEACPGVTFSFEETVAFGQRYNALYERLHDAVCPRWARRLGLPPDIARIFVRPTIVVLTHLFCDRFIRLGRLLRRRNGEDLFVGDAAPLKMPDGLHQVLSRAAYSAETNQSVLCWLAPLWGLPVRPWPLDDPFLKAHVTPPGFINYNYSLLDALQKARKGVRRLALKAARMARPSTHDLIPALSMAYDSSPLEAAGLIGRKGLVVLDLKPFRGGDPRADSSLREDIIDGAAGLFAPALRNFLADIGAKSAGAVRGAPESFARFLNLMTPSNMLEGAPARLAQVKELLAPFQGRPVVMQELGHPDSCYMAAAARSLGMEVVGCQHGGGPGNLDHMRSVAELEYPLCDRFITRGWRRFLTPNPNPEMRAIPMPSPWLSERAKMWRRRLRWARWLRRKPAFDLLLMSDKVLPFPRPGMGMDALSSDQLLGQAALLRSLVEEASRRGISILHKPYNREIALLLGRTFAALEELGGSRYRFDDGVNKGLSPQLVSSCGVVVWDKPSSGFSECVIAGIPTMVLWPRFSSSEPPWAEGVFRELEARGVVHRRAESLCEECLRFREAPRSWMKDPGRVRAIKRFSRRYAWARPDWPRYWRRLLDSFRAPPDG
ncbi:MAG: hypothetical protein HY748_08785 [Elusimicrobia bacterium]|nr:hypothetical protein [Elusimicrobiota bacterium]